MQALRCSAVRAALFGGARISEDLAVALATVATPRAEDVRREATRAASADASGTTKAYVLYISSDLRRRSKVRTPSSGVRLSIQKYALSLTKV